MPYIDFKAKELEYDHKLPEDTDLVVMRLDMRAGTTWTKAARFEKPYDERFARAMDAAALAVFDELPRVIFGYVASDEITMVIAPHTADGLPSQHYSGRIQKLASVCASVAATAFYRQLALDMMLGGRAPSDMAPAAIREFFSLGYPAFDARVFTCTRDEGYAALRSRQKSVIRNAVRGYAHYKLGDAAIKNMSNRDLLDGDMMPEYGEMPADYRIGRLIVHADDLEALDADDGLRLSLASATGLGIDTSLVGKASNVMWACVDFDDKPISAAIDAVIGNRFAFEG